MINSPGRGVPRPRFAFSFFRGGMAIGIAQLWEPGPFLSTRSML